MKHRQNRFPLVFPGETNMDKAEMTIWRGAGSAEIWPAALVLFSSWRVGTAGYLTKQEWGVFGKECLRV